MSTRIKRRFLLLAALVAVLGMPCLAWWHAQRQALALESAMMRRYALEVLRRSERMLGQSVAALETLSRASGASCDDRTLASMQSIAVNSAYIKAIGRVEDGALVCSSLGLTRVPLGDMKFTDSYGYTVYSKLPIASRFAGRIMAVERDGFAAMFDADVWADIADTLPGLSLAVLHTERRADEPVVVPSGFIDRAWSRRLDGRLEATFVDQGHLVGMVRSTRGPLAGVAALPLAHLAARRSELALQLVPPAAVAGVALALALLVLARRQGTLDSALREGLRNDEFFLLYQPVVDLQTGRTTGAEALVRWRRDNGELIGPDLFIPLAEQTGFITQLTERLIELVERDTRALLETHPDFHIALNLSAADLHSDRLVQLLDAMLARGRARPANLVVEITERSSLDIAKASTTIGALRARGIRVAIDDFGTGYAGLSYLKAFEVDTLKIDRSFIEAVGTRAPTNQVVDHIIAMASGLGLAMVAEGVETEAQATYLRARGVQSAQGWLFGKPQAPEELGRRLAEQDLDYNVLL